MKLQSAILCCIAFFCSCTQIQQASTYKNSGVIAQHLIQLCVDSTFRLDSGLNSKKYLVDFKLVKELNRKGVDNFLEANKNAAETDLDSLAKHDPSWVKYEFFKNTFIRFEKITVQEDSTIRIITSKTKASDDFIEAEIILKPKCNSFKCIKTSITKIG